MANDRVRINVNMSEKVMEKVDLYAEENGINRTAALNVIISNYFRQEEAMEAIKAVSAMQPLS